MANLAPRGHVVSLSLALTFETSCARPNAGAVGPETGSSASGPASPVATRSPEQAADEVFAAILSRDPVRARAQARAALAEHPRSPVVAALATVAARSTEDDALRDQAAPALASQPAWRAFAGFEEATRFASRLALDERRQAIRVRLAGHPYLAWIEALHGEATQNQTALEEIGSDPSVPAMLRADALVRLARVQAFLTQAVPPQRLEAQVAVATLARAEALDPTSAVPPLRAAEHLARHGEREQARAALDRAKRLAPQHPDVRVLDWRLRVKLGGESERALIGREAEALRKESPDDPFVLAVAADGYDIAHDKARAEALRDAIATRFPSSPPAIDTWIGRGWGSTMACRTRKPGQSLPAEEVDKLLAPLLGYLDRQEIRGRRSATPVRDAVVELLSCHPTPPKDRVVAIAAEAVLPEAQAATWTHAQLGTLLTKLRERLDLAAQHLELARSLLPQFLDRARPMLDAKDFENESKAHEALQLRLEADLENARGDRTAALALRERAHGLWPGGASDLIAFADLRLESGDRRGAERILDEHLGTHPETPLVRDRRRTLWLAEHGRVAGFERHVTKLRTQAFEKTRTQALASRLAVPRPIPPFSLARDKGGTLASDELAGHVTLVTFSEPWCAGCRNEADDLAKLRDRYRHQKDVRFVIVSDIPSDELATIAGTSSRPVELVRPDTYPERAGVRGLPTHWFLDRQGRIVFETFPTGDLVEACAARIDALRKERP